MHGSNDTPDLTVCEVSGLQIPRLLASEPQSTSNFRKEQISAIDQLNSSFYFYEDPFFSFYYSSFCCVEH